MKNLSVELRQCLLVTANYWAFTLTDGALRMLVVLYFNQLGYSPFEIAMLFIFYEVFGVITNLVGGWLGARIGLNRIMNIGLGIQIIALSMLLVPNPMLSVLWVMVAQALSGVAKDLNKMSAKSAVKGLVPQDAPNKLFKWVAILTGSKNALKGMGFFLGGFLLTLFGFKTAVLVLASALSLVWLVSLVMLRDAARLSESKPKLIEIFAKTRSINYLSAARLFLFAARDVWFVVALPVYMAVTLEWEHASIGGFFAVWIMVYGAIQSVAPKLIHVPRTNDTSNAKVVAPAIQWVAGLAVVTAALSLGFSFGWVTPPLLVLGLFVFGAVFAVNSSLHSFMIVSLASADNTSMDVGFYYMANAMGRLVGTVLSGLLYQYYGLEACLYAATVFLIITFGLSQQLSDT